MTEFGAQVEAKHYASWAYNSKGRLCSMWHQTDEVRQLGASTVLEVGPGPGTVTGWLRDRGLEVRTVDVDPALEPDDVASVTALPYADAAFDVALCCEVLEHLPFDAVGPALAELRRVSRLGVVVSLPDDRPWAGISFPVYFGLYADELRRRYPVRRWALRAAIGGRIRWRDAAFLALVPRQWSRNDRAATASRPPIPHVPWRHEFDGEHHWEIGTEGFPVERVTAAIEAASLVIERDFRVPEWPWHHFWTLRPR